MDASVSGLGEAFARPAPAIIERPAQRNPLPQPSAANRRWAALGLDHMLEKLKEPVLIECSLLVLILAKGAQDC